MKTFVSLLLRRLVSGLGGRSVLAITRISTIYAKTRSATPSRSAETAADGVHPGAGAIAEPSTAASRQDPSRETLQRPTRRSEASSRSRRDRAMT